MPPKAAARVPDIAFLVPGVLLPPGAALKSSDADNTRAPPPVRGHVRTAVRMVATRGTAEPVRVAARPGEDVVVLTVQDGPTLVLHPEDARDLMRAQGSAATRGASAPGDNTAVPVPAQLAWPGLEAPATRGLLSSAARVVLTSFAVVTGVGKDQAVTLTTAAITKKLDGKVQAGLYALKPGDLPATLKGSGQLCGTPPAPVAGPMLVLVHGTFVDTPSTFGSLWAQHRAQVDTLFAHYAGQVYALDHPTLGQSPIANALTLAQALPAGARLHLLTHSRGGLVAEVLARVCGAGTVGADDLAYFKGAGYSRHRADLVALAKEVQTKGITVERVVRVGCPARGTLLASGRFDAYLSVLKWGLELAAVPVAPELVDFLYEVARRRADPAELPGMEAMRPDSGLVQWINSGGQPIPGALRVVAGDMAGDSVGSWVKTLLADAFYWTDNDLVVQTRSMYGGTARADQASFVLDRGGKVSHFAYFKNDRTVAAMVAGLTESAPVDFKTIGPLSWAGQDASGTRGRGLPDGTGDPASSAEDVVSPRVERAVLRSRGADAAAAASRPAVFVLPGILGSNLKLDGERIWVGLRFVNGLKKLAWDPATAARVQAESPVGSTYDTLVERLADSHEVIPFAYDWRRPTEDEARRLALQVEAALDARQASQQPVRILAHSMGGLLARTLQLEKPDTWRRLMDRRGARLLMLGTPNAGSWSPMQVLSGDDSFGNALVAFGSLFDNRGARETMAGMPGFLQLQAGLRDPVLGLDQAARWQQLADDDLATLKARSVWHALRSQTTVYAWGAPPEDVLKQAVELRRRLDAQAASLGADAQKMLLVTGQARFTPDGYRMGADGLEYLNAVDGGDGRVTHASAALPGVATWHVDAVHGDLPGVADAFPGYLELLETGDTQRLPRVDQRSAARGASVGAGSAPSTTDAAVEHVPSRPSREPQRAEPPSRLADIFTTPEAAATASEAPPRRAAGPAPLSVSVRNGDLKFVREPMVVGHYRSLMLTGTEGVTDALLGRTMSQSLAAGLYPDAPGSQQIFLNLRRPDDNLLDVPRPRAVVVAGLGDEGKLRATDLIYTVCQAVLAYAQRVAESPGEPTQFEMAATLIGSGGTGITAGAAAQLVAQGAYEATLKLRQSRGRHGKAWPQLSHLTLVEFYLDRASEAWRALQVQAIAAPDQVKVVGWVLPGEGAMRRSLDSSYRGAAYDLISALKGPVVDGQPSIAYTLDTRRARTEVRAQQAQGPLLKELVAKASNDANRDAQIGRTLFNLLVPVEMEPFLGGTSEMLIEVDETTAVIPWELLDTAQQHLGRGEAKADDKPWAIRSKLLRKLQLDST
ncbi:MAG: hypothetical protein JWP29_3341 [Rhodoferax sp.]|nr:hypothetical protein [Rhodoferax sp.]